MSEKSKGGFFNNPLLKTQVKSANVKLKEILFGYFIGPFGALLSSGIFGAFLNDYFNNVLFSGQRTDAVKTFLTLLPLLSVVLVVAGNLVVGQLIERTKSMQGKARPWILLSAFILSVSSVLMFIVPFQNAIAKMVWLAISYNLYYAVAFPIYNTAYSTMIPVSTRNGKQRGLLASAANISGLAVMGAGTMVFPILVSNLLKESVVAWFVTFLAIAIFSFMACILQYYFTRERVTEETLKLNIVKEKTPVKQQLKAVASDKWWWLVIIAWLCVQIGGMMQNVSMPFFSRWVVDSVGGDWGLTMTILSIAGAIPMAVAVVLVWPLSNKFGKKNVTVVGLIIGTAGGILAGLMPNNMISVAIGIALQCLGAAPVCYMILAMLADELDHLEAKHGFRCDGFTMSIYSLIAAATIGIATAVLNGMLDANGYIEAVEGVTGIVQPDTANTVMTVGYIWVRTIAFAIAGILLLFFTVEKNLPKEQADIIERQKAEAIAAGKEWVEPSERLRLEQEQADIEAEEARIAESKAACEKKGLDFEKVEAQYQAKLKAKQEAAEAKKAKKNK